MIFLLIVLVIFLGVLLVRNYLIDRELNRISEKLEDINKENSHEKLKVALINKKIERLSNAINKTIEIRIKSEADKVKSEDKLRQAIADMSHDLRTPLTAIKGYIKFLKTEDLNDTERGQYIEIIEKRAATLEILLNDFYSLSLIDSHDFKLNIEKVDISRAVQEIMFSRYIDFENKGIEPEININDNIVYIAADKNALERTIDNLITNAIKYAENNIKVTLSTHGRSVFLKIDNNSNNLKNCNVNSIFDRFYMADKTRSGQGTGLGLSITKELVDKMNGKITAKIINDVISICVEFDMIKREG
ncbi:MULTISPECIES: sensor histidine kinase [Clostridium]|uniref:sensor histidine kinase n=1 Tax=Clostridium TaxID=1485 RepID=UPI0008271F87|nr:MULTISPECIES: HAMP domain-containing sensor histidine kinase [Clostridium]PJI07471.1 sensor histidine kinase [Clostridium sp. CT7]